MKSKKEVKHRHREVSDSRIKTYTGCKRKYKLTYKDRLSPVIDAPNLSFGKLFHECLRKFYENKLVTFETVIQAWLKDYKQAIVEHSNFAKSEWDIDTIKAEELAKLCTGLMHDYVQKYASDHSKWEIIAVEQPFLLPLHVPCPKCGGEGCKFCKKTGLGRKAPELFYRGYMDLIIREKSKPDVAWVVEHKTTVNKDIAAYMNDLVLDTQPRGYVWAAKQLMKINKLDCDIAGVIYNVCRKKIPSVPATTQCRKCKGTGRSKPKVETNSLCPICNGTGVGGISKAQIDTLPEIYAAELNKYPHLNLDDYIDQLQVITARKNRFLMREYHYVSTQDMLDWELELYHKTRDMFSTKYFYRNETACNIPGRKCAYRRICLEDNEMARRNFVEREPRSFEAPGEPNVITKQRPLI